MKKFLSLLLVLTLVSTLVACNNKKDIISESFTSTPTQTEIESTNNTKKTESETTDKGSNDTEIQNGGTSAPTTSNKHNTTSGKPNATTSKPAETNKPITSTHAHSYSKKVTAATCNKKGYTTYTCSCGTFYISDYTNLAAHSYADYVCSVCDEIDKSHAYEFLRNFVLANGTINTKTGNIDFVYSQEEKESLMSKHKYTTLAGLTYNSSNKTLCAWYYSDYKDPDDTYAWISLYDYYYSYYSLGSVANGYIDPNTFTFDSSNIPIKYSMIYSALFSLNIFFLENNLSIRTYDLGFKSLQVGAIK